MLGAKPVIKIDRMISRGENFHFGTRRLLRVAR
jgi:hypothetical protein